MTNPSGVLRAIRRHFWRSLAIILSSLALAALVSLLWPKSYSADTTLVYDPQIPLSKGGGALPMTDAQRDAAIDAQLANVATMAVAADVARSVDLAANPKLQQEAQRVAASSERPLSREEALGTVLLKQVQARRIGQTPMFTIGFRAANAVQAAWIANRFADSYLKSALAQKTALADRTARRLATRVAELHQAAVSAERQLAGFRLANHLLEPPGSSAVDQEVAGLRGQLAEAHGQAALAGKRSAVGLSGENSATIVGGGAGGSIDTTAVSALTQQRAVAAADLAALQGRYGENHPEIIAARQKLTEVDAQLADAMNGNRSSAMVEARAAGARAQALAGSLGAAQTQQAANVSYGARLLDLQNEAIAAELAYQDAVKINADQMAQRTLAQPDAQVTAVAYPPLRAKSPNLRLDLLVALVLGLIAAAVAACLSEARRRTLGRVEDVVHWLDLDYFEPLPMFAPGVGLPGADAVDRIAAALLQPQSAFAASIGSLATAALFTARKRDSAGGRVIGIASARRGEGRTTASIALGRVLAAAGMKVALVDGDPRGGTGIHAMGQSPEASAGPEGAEIDSSGLATFASDDQRDLAQKVGRLRHEYDVVVVDIAPVLSGSESRPLLVGADALVLLARWHATPVRTIRKAMRQIIAAGGHISGVALSMVRAPALESDPKLRFG